MMQCVIIGTLAGNGLPTSRHLSAGALTLSWCDRIARISFDWSMKTATDQENLRGGMTTSSPQFVALVDDDPNLRAAFEDLLRSAGLAAETFPSAEEFLQQAGREAVRWLVLDLGLPGMGGLELLRHLRANGWSTPIVCITAMSDSEGKIDKRALEAGAQTILYKPFDSEELLHLLQSNGDHNKGGPDIEQRAGTARRKRRS
jgi:FixJ family two-component response regulator